MSKVLGLENVQPHESLPPFLKAQEVAEYLGQPVGTIRYWVHTGYGPKSVRMGKSRRWPREQLLAWVAVQMEDAA